MAAISVGTPSSAAISTVQSARLANLPSAKTQHYWLPPVPSATAPKKPSCKIIARYRRAVRGGAAARPQTRAACRGRADFNNQVFQNAELKDSGKSVVQFVARCELSSFPLQILCFPGDFLGYSRQNHERQPHRHSL